MKITTNNYFATIKKIGFENLPLPLKQSHTVILTKTVNGENWASIKTDKDFKSMVDMTFSKLGEYLKSNQSDALDGINKKRENPYSKISKEVYFIDRFLQFHDKILYKNTFGIFIDELQKAIQEKKITKKSPVAKEIMEIQKAVLSAFNTMKNAKHFVLKPTTIKHLKSIMEKYENAYDDIEEDTVQEKKKQMGLSGINQMQETIPNQTPINIMKSTDFINMRFNSLGFKHKWLAFIGDPSAGFTMMVFGMPKMGKSYLCVDFAGYLARNHGRVLYVAKEEKLDRTLQDKLRDKNVAHENLTVADAIPSDLSAYDFVFLDSVNKLRLTPEDLERLKANNKGKSFIYIFQATKGGQFKGNNEFQHDVDVVVEIPEIGKAVQYGRFNQGGELDIFENSQPRKDSLDGTTKKAKYPSWTMPKHLDAVDHFKLKHIYDLYKRGEFSEAYDYASYNCDTIIREEIPPDVWKALGGQLTKTGEEKLKASRKLLVSSKKSNRITTELSVPLEELAIEMLPKSQPKEDILYLIDNQITKVERAVKKMAEQLITDEKSKVKIASLKFTQTDSRKLSNGVSYYEVELEGEKPELEKIAGEDKLFYYEW